MVMAPHADPVTLQRLDAVLREAGALRPGNYVDAAAAELAARVIHTEAHCQQLESLARLGAAVLAAAARGTTLAPHDIARLDQCLAPGRLRRRPAHFD